MMPMGDIMKDSRFLVTNAKGYAIAVFMYEGNAEFYKDMVWDQESQELEIEEIPTEDVHEYF